MHDADNHGSDTRLLWSVALADELVVHTWPEDPLAVVYARRERTTHLIDAEVAAVCRCLEAGSCSVAELAIKLERDSVALLGNTEHLDGFVGVLLALQDARLLVLQPC